MKIPKCSSKHSFLMSPFFNVNTIIPAQRWFSVTWTPPIKAYWTQAGNIFFPVRGYLGASARIGCGIWPVCFSEVYLLLFLPVSNCQKGFSNSVHLLLYLNQFKCKIYFSYFKKINVTSPLAIEIRNQSKPGNQCQGAKTLCRK